MKHLPTLHHLVDLVKLNFSNRPSHDVVEAVELWVHMDCPGCERTVRKALSALKGIHSVEIDREQQKVTVTGFVDKYKVLNRVRRKGKVAEFWPRMQLDALDRSPSHLPSLDSLPSLQQHQKYAMRSTQPYAPPAPSSVYNNIRPHGPLVDAFSEDNANNCSLM